MDDVYHPIVFYSLLICLLWTEYNVSIIRVSYNFLFVRFIYY